MFSVPMVLTLLALAVLVEMFGFAYHAVLPAVARGVLQVGEVGLGTLSMMVGFGSLAGVMVLTALGNLRRKGPLLIGITVGYGAFLLALAMTAGGRKQNDEDTWGAALVDLSTGEFSAAEYTGSSGRQAIVDEVSALRPREVIVAGDLPLLDRIPELAAFDLPVTTLDAWVFDFEHARETLCDQLRTATLDGSELGGHAAATAAAGALVQYLRDTQKVDLAHVRSVDFRSRADHVLIDATTLRHLEILAAADGGGDGSLLAEIDRTATPMGGRLLRARLQRPARAIEVIQDRLDAVDELLSRGPDRARLRETLKAVHDLERLVARIALRTAGPRDLVSLRQSVALIPTVRDHLAPCSARPLCSLAAQPDAGQALRGGEDDAAVRVVVGVGLVLA
jgi:DNA mismatch repair ATPase MutS